MLNEEREVLMRQPKISISNAAEFLNISVQSLHKQIKAKKLICPKIGKKFYITHSIARELFNIPFEHKVIVGQIVKGGTGKTTTIDNIACAANVYGARVLKVDIDPQGNLTDANGVDAEEYPTLIDVIEGDQYSIEDCVVNISEGMDLIPSRIENVTLDNTIVNKRFPLDRLFHNILKPISNNYDYIFIDCPPTIGQTVTAAALYADTILVPLNPDKFSAKGLKIIKNEISNLSINFNKEIDYKVYLNKFSNKTILSEKALMTILSDRDLEGKFLTTMVQFSQEIPNITDEMKNVFSQTKKSPVRDDFDNLARELLGLKLVKGKYQEANSLEKNIEEVSL